MHAGLKSIPQVVRIKFDPANKQHRQAYKTFISKGTWEQWRFDCEFPFLELPAMIERKLALYACEK